MGISEIFSFMYLHFSLVRRHLFDVFLSKVEILIDVVRAFAIQFPRTLFYIVALILLLPLLQMAVKVFGPKNYLFSQMRFL